MDLFVLPSHREGFPRAAMEAAASGLAVVATDIRGCREVVEPGGNGLLVPVADPAALAAAITEIGEDPRRRAAMGAQSRRLAEQRFDERSVVATVFATYHGVALRKGYRPVLDAAGPLREPVIRPARDRDIPHLARMHADAIADGFLPRLGAGFMERLYQAMVDWDGSEIFVADGGLRPVGFVAGVTDVGAFYRHFVRHHGAGAALAAAPRLLRPRIARRAWETLRYEGDHGGVAAELLAMAVVPEARRRGVATALGARLLEALSARGEAHVKVVVGAGNDGAVAAYRGMGFSASGVIEVHAGEKSQVLTWSAPH
jgi:ribosomal protein S18 acetylase RimI-like enzyme